MAYTIEQYPNIITAANSPMVFVLKDTTNNAATKFRYIAQVFINGSEKAKLKIFKNNADVGIIDIHKIVRSYLETQTLNVGDVTADTINGSIHSIGISDTSNAYSQNTNQIVKVELKAGFEKSASATQAPEETLNQANQTIYSTPATTPYTKTSTIVGGGLDIDSGSTPTANNPMNVYVPQNTTKRFLTNAPTVQFVRGSSTSADNVDELTLAFFQDGLISDALSIDKINVSYYQADGTLIGSHDIDNTTALGGHPNPSTTVNDSLIYFGCGTANLESFNDGGSNNHRPSNNANWVYYTVKGMSSANAQRTQAYSFYRYGAALTGIDDRHQSCSRYNNIRLAWRNRVGCWDYMNFRLKSTESVDIQSEEMERVVGTWDSATYNYDNTERGRETLYTNAKRKITINSDYLNEEESAWLEELFTSINVQILAEGNVVYPVIITNKTYTKKTSVNNKIKIQYTINLEYANKIRTNS